MDDMLLQSLEDYNEYIMERLKLIYDFDVWYEHTTNNPFPKEWYAVIQEGSHD